MADLGDRQNRFETTRHAIENAPASAMRSYADEVAAWDQIDRG